MKQKMKYKALETIEKDHFNKMAKDYDQNYGYYNKFTKYKIHKKASQLVELLREHKLSKRAKILEVGCGTGAYTLEVAKKLTNVQITAIDVSPEIIKVAKEKTKKYKNVSYKVDSIYDTKFKDQSVDVVFGFYVLHHLINKKALEEIYRILKPGGLVYFYEPNILNPIVFLIKSNKWLKRLVGDSPDEWAINPLKVKKYFGKFEVIGILTSEFIVPIRYLSYSLILKIDHLTRHINKIPLVKYLGGSVQIVAQKSDK